MTSRAIDPELDFEIAPYTVIVDTREQHPYSFQGFTCDAAKRYKPLIVPLEVAGLRTGDYSLKGFESVVAVERKSLSDLYGSLGQNRERFQREFERLAEMEYAALVIEAGWGAIIGTPPPNSKLLPKTVYRTLIAWQQRYGVHVWPCDTRNFAERSTLRMLERFWWDKQKATIRRQATARDTA